MKKILALTLSFILIFSLSACQFLPGARGEVTVRAGGREYPTVENRVGDKGLYTAEDFSEDITELIPYSSDLTINIEGAHSGKVLYSLYDGSFNEFYSREPQCAIPAAEGTYYCIVELTWGEEAEGDTCQYGFCFARTE